MDTTRLGHHYEALACQYLGERGFSVITTNYHAPRTGEIDIIATGTTPQGRALLIFVEVRARTASNYASAAESITPTKQRKIMTTAEHFLQSYPKYGAYDCRFDVITFDITDDDPKLTWIEHAFMIG